MKKTPRIVNVIEVINNVVSSVDTFVIPTTIKPHSKEEQKIVDVAEKLFAKIAKENGMAKKDLEACLDDGYYEEGTYKVVIHWSNEDTDEKTKNLK